MTLDNCQGCGKRVTDFDPDGFEGSDGQRGHYTCGQAPEVYKDYRPAVEDMTEMGFHAG